MDNNDAPRHLERRSRLYPVADEPVAVPAAAERRRRLFGEAIKRHRGLMTQAQLGDLLGGVPQTTVSRWEAGLVDFSYEQVADLEFVLELRPGTLGHEAGYLDSPDGRDEESTIITCMFDDVDDAVRAVFAAERLGLGVSLQDRQLSVGDDCTVEQWVVDILQPR